jgi:hypothetical protein
MYGNPRVHACSFVCAGISLSGFRVDIADGVKLHLLDDVSTWEAGDRIVVASTDYSMYQAEELTLLRCPECSRSQVKVKGRGLLTDLGKHAFLGICFLSSFLPSPRVSVDTTDGLSGEGANR